ncbi:MAG: amidohydrolase family protein [Ignavibacteriaceae bacterium]|nr:amidohydrolase family protein [Ignavibacteriaceae bacterium]
MKKLLLSALLLLLSGNAFSQYAVKGGTVYTMAGEVIKNGVILVEGGKIKEVGKDTDVDIPSDYKVYSFKVVTPGLIDARTSVGLSGILNYAHDQDQLEKSDAVQPELRAIDAYNPNEDLVTYLRNLGVTTLHTGHSRGALASGQTMIVKTLNEPGSGSILDSAFAVSFSLGSIVSQNYKTPGTSAKGMAILRDYFKKAADYLKKKDKKDDKTPSVNLTLEALASVLKGDLKALIFANTSVEIAAAIRLAQEFGFSFYLDGASESYLWLKELKSKDIPVLLHPTMERAYGSNQNISFTTAAKLDSAGIRFAIQGGFEGYVPKARVVLFEAGVAAAYGLTPLKALESVTIGAAKLLGIENRVGSLEEGKDADIVGYDGDPLEYTSHVCFVMINGKVVSTECN